MNTVQLIVQIKFGSHLYGTATPDSDLDIKCVYLPDARDILLQRVGPLLSDSRPKAHGERNTSADTDREAFSLQRYLELLAEGQTVALDMLFAPDWAMIAPPDNVWREIQTLAPRILTRGATAFVRYCRQQANKYGIKGSRVAAARKALAALQAAEASYGTQAKLSLAEADIEKAATGQEFLVFEDIPQPNGGQVRAFSICGKKAIFTNSIGAARAIAQHQVEEYGQRALAAESNQGVDWKALSHAVRVGREALELFQTGRIVFPRPEAAHLLDIKRGQLPYASVATEIEQLLEAVEEAALKSTLPDSPDMKIIDDFVADIYRRQVLK